MQRYVMLNTTFNLTQSTNSSWKTDYPQVIFADLEMTQALQNQLLPTPGSCLT